MWTKTCLLLWSFFVANSSGNQIDSCATDWTSLSTGCYQFVQAGSFTEASSNCVKEGGFLVEVNSQKEQDALAQFLEDSKLKSYIFLGGTDEQIEGKWRGKHSGREVMTFDGWRSGNPSGGLYENCVYTRYNYKFKWLDISCSWKTSGVALCEYHNQTQGIEEQSNQSWEEGKTMIYVNYNKYNSYKCDVSFMFNISNIDLKIQFKDIISICSESDGKEGAIHSLGIHSFELSAQSGIRIECSLGAAMVNGNLSQTILDDSLHCITTNSSCSVGWTNLGLGCYRFVKAGSYQEATSNCENEGGYLVEIDNQEEQDVLSQFLQDSFIRSYVWIGGTDEEREGRWVGNYSGREIMKFDSWYYSYPNGGFHENCAYTHQGRSFKWDDMRCSYESNIAALCEYPEKNESSTTTITTPQLDSCVDGWTSLETGCYRFVNAKSVQEATNNCGNEGGYLVEIENQEEQDAISQFLEESKLRSYIWLGGTDHEIEGKWIGNYSRKEIMKFNAWYTGYPRGGFNDNCVRTSYWYAFKWDDIPCSYTRTGLALCEYPDQNETTTTINPVTVSDPCLNGWTNLSTGCYRLIKASSHQEAKTNCNNEGGYLVEIDTQEEQDQLALFYEDSRLRTYVWLGGTDENREGHWIGNYSGREIMKNAWLYSSYPSGGFEENCLITHYSWQFKWDDKSCSYGAGNAAALCEYPTQMEPLLNSSTPDIDPCLRGWTNLTTGCYRLIKASSHQEATTNCNNEGGYLVEIDTQEEQDQLALFYEDSKLRTYVWLGGTDENREGHWIGNYSGREIMKFNAWYRYGYPRGGLDENCLTTSKSINFKWEDTSCSATHGGAALCEYTDQNDTLGNSATSVIDSCGSRWSSLTTGCYRFVKAGSYQEATTNCENEGGYLVEIDTQEEQDVLTQFLQDSQLRHRVLLGGTDEGREGRWIGRNSRKEIMEFNGWYYGYPEKGLYGNCIYTYHSYNLKWRDYSCSWKGSAVALCERQEQNQTTTTPNTGVISPLTWEQEKISLFISHNRKNYKCEMSFDFSINNVSLTVQFKNFDSKCGDDESGEDYIESVGKYSFMFTSSSGFRMDCTVNVAMVNEDLSQPVIEDSLHCIPTNNCLHGWSSLSTGCYQLVKAGSHQEAMINCQTEGGYLVEIDSQDEQDAVVQFLEESQIRSHIWLGGSDQVIEGHWIGNYSGQEIMKFNGWRYSYPGGAFDENCVWTNYGMQFRWDDYKCSYKSNIAALCEYPNENDTSSFSTTSVDLSEDCESSWSSLATGCYKFIKVTSNREAITSCNNEGGYLVEIETQEEQDALTQFHQDSQLRMITWLGGTDEEREGQWVGSHSGKILSFTAWASGQPAGGLHENCVVTDRGYKFKWYDVSCSRSGTSAALCEMSHKSQHSTTSSHIGKETTMPVSRPTPSECPVCPNLSTASTTVSCPMCTTPLLTTSQCRACPNSTPTLCPSPEVCPTPEISSPTICPTESCPVCPDPITTTLNPDKDTCLDAGCKNAFNGLGMCVDTHRVDWGNVSKIIDFSAGIKEGKCSSTCRCKCFKHTGCYSTECDKKLGICLIPEQEEKRGFFIPAEYKKAFPCDASLDCHCYIKNYEGATKTLDEVTTPQTMDVVTKAGAKSTCKASKKAIKKCSKKKGECFGKEDIIPKNAKRKGWCNKNTGCKCYKV